MIGLRRHLALSLGLLAFATAFQPVGFAASGTNFGPAADEVSDAFEQGVQALREGRKQDALHAFQAVLALDPSQESAYELWQSVDEDIWLQMLVENGEMELVARRFLDLAKIGSQARENNPDAIRALLKEVESDDVGVRTRAIRKLAANHGEYAVPFLLYGLADQEDANRRVIFMQALTRMGDDVVPAMLEGLDSPDAFLRRNIALTLGHIGDPRANGELAHHAANDADGAVRDAAQEALERCGGNSDAVAQLLAKGEGYYKMDPSVLAPNQVSRVVWSWTGRGVEPTEVPRFLYASEMGKKAFARALAIDPSSHRALAALAGTIAAQQAELDARTTAGMDVGDWPARLVSDRLAVGIAGADALDAALGWALDAGDATAASGIVQSLGEIATASTDNLENALVASSSGAVRGEAALALGHISARSSTAPSAATVAALAQVVGREVVRIAVVIDADQARSEALSNAMAAEGVMATPFANGARGLIGLRTLPGTDAIVLSDMPGKVTAFQVLAEIARDERLAGIPVVMIAADKDAAEELYGDKVTAIITGADGSAAVLEAMSDRMNADREEANGLASRAGSTLAHLAAMGLGDLSSTTDALDGVLQNRPDEVAGPALAALGHLGGVADVPAVAAVVTDNDRSAELRATAAHALAGIFGRIGTTDEATLSMLIEVCRSDSPESVRQGTASALGRLNLSAEVRAEIVRAVRSGADS